MIKKYILNHIHKKIHNEQEFYKAYKIFFGTLVSGSRLKIINLLRKEEKNVSEIVGALKISQPAVSHDLARLKKCGFVNVKINKNFRYYSINKETIKPLMDLIDVHMSKYCIHIIHEIKGDKRDG
ncbi:winged helix-turn-helix transcriptional regulator [Candidatus Woesearchaeota archaeon]|nr:winged helix-turn-helix transcriptional regulator [Candidatus Woesearchaeota archaeon]